MSWYVTANEIDRWTSSNTRKAQELLPELIKKLILATVDLKNIHIPTGDSILTGGWDGIINVSKGNIFISEGINCLEFGTNTSINLKANNDYIKRTQNEADQNKTYIFATTRTWSKKNEFEEEKNTENKWKNVQGINADDIETWLTLAPAVHRWFATILSKRTSSCFDVEQACDMWVTQTKIQLIPNLVLFQREEEIEKLKNFLLKEPSRIVVKSASEQESYAFIINIIKKDIRFLNRTIIVTEQATWNRIIETNNSLILIYKNFIPDNIGYTISKGHFVIEARESSDTKDKNCITLQKMKKLFITTVLQEMEFENDKAWKIYNETKGFIHAIINHPLLEPYEKNIPRWVDKYDINILTTILFINSWHSKYDSDTKAIESLSGLNYEEFEKQLYLLQAEKNPPLRLVGNVWQVISKINLWDLIANKIPNTQMNKLKKTVISVFSEIDPSFELAPEERWSAHIYDKTLNHSGLIRESLADTLALISVFGNDNLNYLSDISNTIDFWLEELFESNLNVESWYSYDRILSLLAEASPNSFITALEKTLNNKSDTKIEELFEDPGDMAMGTCFHCDLLWALETVSWHKDYLARVTLILIRLSELNIKSKISNSPMNTLKEIFAGWINYSSVSYGDKVQILEQIAYKKFPDTTWKLLIGILPNNHSVSSGISKPKYQNWDVDSTKKVTNIEYNTYNENIFKILFQSVENNTLRWKDVLDNITSFSEEYCIKFLNKFTQLDKKIFSDDERLILSLKLRENIHNHRKFTDSPHWQISEECLEKLENAFYFIEPDNLVHRYYHLFGNGSINLLNPIPYEKENRNRYKEEETIIEEERVKAVQNILENKGFDTLVELIRISQMPGIIGRLIFKTTGEKYKIEIFKWLDMQDGYLNVCAKNYVASMKFNENILDGLNDIQKAEILLAINFDSIAFESLKKQNTTIQEYYWKNIHWYYRLEESDKKYIKWIFEQLYRYKQHMKCIDFLSHHMKKGNKHGLDFSFSDIAKVLIELDPNIENNRLDTHSISEVIELLQNLEVENEVMRLIEWKYLQLKNFNPIFLEKEIITNPKSFIELVTFIYNAQNKKDEDTTLTKGQIKNRANNAIELLKRVTLFKKYEDTQDINYETLKNWIDEAIKYSKEVDREKYSYIEIGKLLSKSPKGKDDIFPNEITRDILEEFDNEMLGYYFWHEKKYPGGSYFTTRGAYEGGEQESQKAKEYSEYSEKLRFTHIRTSFLLTQLAQDYEKDAKKEDLRQELN
jgi:hypothetical protein